MWASIPFSFLLSPVRSAQAAARPSIGPISAARKSAELRAARGTSEFLHHVLRILCYVYCVSTKSSESKSAVSKQKIIYELVKQ